MAHRLRDFISGCRSLTARDLEVRRADEYLNRIQLERDWSARTINKTITAVKGWLRWCVRARLLPYSPLDALATRKGEVRHQRRPLTTDEIGRLLAAALDGPARRARNKYRGGGPRPGRLPLAGQELLARKGRGFALAYRLMLTAGLRLNEVRQLRWVDVDLGVGLLFVQGDKGDKLRGIFTRKELPLPPDTIDALAHWKAECGHSADTDHVVRVPTSLVETLDDDLRAAGIPKRDALNRVVD